MKLQMPNLREFLRKNRGALVVLLLAAVLFVGFYLYTHPNASETTPAAEEYAEYESGVVQEILSDSCEPDPTAENAYRGSQTLLAEITSGRYKGKTYLTSNAVGPLFGEPVQAGDHITVILSTYADGTIQSTVYEYDRSTPIYLLIGLFFLTTILVGGKTGLQSILGLVFTVGVLLTLLIPLLLKGWPTIPTTFLMCGYVAIVSFVVLGGLNRKVICAALGTIAGMAMAMVFGLAAQKITHIDGLRISDVEALLQLRQTGTPIGLRGLLVAGIIISALGAVMDVAMSISSALWEVKTVNPALGPKELWKSGMNIGRDMVGTMTNTLILAFLGSGFTLIIYLYSLNLPFHELMSSAYMGLEVVSGVASAIGVILSVPVTALLCAVCFCHHKKSA